MDTTLIQHDVTGDIIGLFYDVYNELGFGFLEYIYINALKHELRRIGRRFDSEVPVPVLYKGVVIGTQRVDLIVEGKVILEVKSSRDLPDIAARQLDNYLKGTGIKVGLLLHFGPSAKFYRRVWTKTKNPEVSAEPR